MGCRALNISAIAGQQQAGPAAPFQFCPEAIMTTRPRNRHMRNVCIVKEVQFLEIELEVAALFPCVMPLITHQLIQLMRGANGGIEGADIDAEHGTGANVIMLTYAFSEVEQPILDRVLVQRET